MKLQSAMEYLTTYGWAVLLIMIVIGVLFFLGVFNTANYQASAECAMGGGFSCTNVSMAANGLITYTITDNTADPVNVIGFGCGTNQSNAMLQYKNSLPQQDYLPVGDNVTTSMQCLVSPTTAFQGGQVGDVFSGYVSIEYEDDVTSSISLAYGRVSVKIT